MQEILEIIQKLKAYNVGISICDEQIKLENVPIGFPKEVTQQIRSKKKDILSFLKHNNANRVENIIPKVQRKKLYPLSGSQKRIWLLSQLEGGAVAYNSLFCYELYGKIDTSILKKSILELINRHESLRTVFVQDGGELWQKIVNEYNPEDIFKYIDLSLKNSFETDLKSLINSELQITFNLSSGPLLKVKYLRQSNNKGVLLFNIHHIICDGWSMNIILKDLLVNYKAFIQNKKSILPQLNIQFKDFSTWNNQQYQKGRFEGHKEYWKKQFEGELPVLDLPTDKPRPKYKSFNGSILSFEISEQVTQRLKKFCQFEQVTLFLALLAFVKTLLYRYTGQTDLVIGVPVAGREQASLENQVGFYANTLAIRSKFKENCDFEELLTIVKEITLEAYEHQAYGFDKLVEDLKINRDLSRSPLFDVMVVLQNTEFNTLKQLEFDHFQIEPYTTEHVVSKFDMSFSFVEYQKSIKCDIEYNTDLFDYDKIERLSGHLLNIIKTTIRNPKVRINEFNILTIEESHQIVNDFNNTDVDYPKEKTIIHLFEESIEKYPNNIALIHENEHLTYKEFYSRVLSLTNKISEYQIKKEDVVAVIADRSFEMIIAIYAILKAGAAYLPIDPDYPFDRIAYILKDSEAKLIIVDNYEEDSIQFNTNNFPPVLNLVNFIYEQKPDGKSIINQPNDLAYIIYTSGSTGRPKGVMIEHRSLTNIIYYLQSKYPLTQRDAYLFKTTFTFDVSVAEIFGWFHEGGKLVILQKSGEKDSAAIYSTIKRNKVTHVNFAPSMFSLFIEGQGQQLNLIPELKYFFLAGEALSNGIAKKFKDLNTKIQLENIYGPTESTIYASNYSLANWTADVPVYIGKPVNNVKLYILNKNNQIQPIGVPGELIITGESLARGYLNNESTNQEKFILLEFNSKQIKAYKTGDLAKFSQNGNIEFLGRIDNQVKVRGFRIELGEIEKCLQENSNILESIVHVFSDQSGNNRIIAYFISNKKIEPEIIKSGLVEKLPGYMVPDLIIQVDEFPKKSNGKVDRNKLAIPDLNQNNERIAPRNNTEEKLAEIWSEVLEIDKEKISVDANFFEMGGNSILVGKLLNRIKGEFNSNITFTNIFNIRNIIKLAELIEKKNLSSHTKIVRIDKF